ncbi:Gp49 family protein [Brucella intermedia]|uniref:Gp49 family protein n=1 Tax=Brucella intermedia TaxID=94625 RepID=UPI00224A88D0|nr:Gp49 family protein [Brucella intermedia]
MSKEYEAQVDRMIKDAGLTAPRVTPEHIDSLIVDKTFTVLPSGKVMVCEITLKNGFTVRGEASAVSKENFNEEIGRKVSFDKARAQIWPLEGYRLQNDLYIANLPE